MPIFENYNNRIYDDRATGFAPQLQQSFAGRTPQERIFVDTGVKLQENGDVHFGYYAPNAKAVTVVFGIDQSKNLRMTREENGVWNAVLPYDPAFSGAKPFYYDVDGQQITCPFAPQFYSGSYATNYVDIPDPNAPFVVMQDVPHGTVSIEFYWSAQMNSWQRCFVYTPPMYQKSGEDYPVLYLQHGAFENETSWVYNGRAAHIMDNLIAEGKAVPCVIVMNDGMVRPAGAQPGMGGDAFAGMLLNDCIPFIEDRYRVKTDKWSRAIAGFSMGSMQACKIALTNPDKFGYAGLFSGFMRNLGGSDISLEANPHLNIMADKERFLSEYKVFYRAIGSRDVHKAAFDGDDILCAELGFDQYPNITRRVFENYYHDWAVLRIMLYEFAQLIFR